MENGFKILDVDAGGISPNSPETYSGDWNFFDLPDRTDRTYPTDQTYSGLRHNLLQHSGAVSMAFGHYAEAMEQGQPCVTKWGVVGNDNVLAQFDVRGTAGEQGGAVAEFVAGANVAPINQGDIVEQPAAVGFLGCLELVEETGQHLALGSVTLLGCGQLFRPGGVIVAHVMLVYVDTDAGEQRTDGLAEGEDP